MTTNIAKIRPVVLWFAMLMEQKLRKHDATRGERGWTSDDSGALLDRVDMDLHEAYGAIVLIKTDPAAFVDECADIANMAMMAADVANGCPEFPPEPESLLWKATLAKDMAYSERNKLVSLVSKVFPSWLGRHKDSDTTWDNDWRNIVFVRLPTGQASWHIHDGDLPLFSHLSPGTETWDGHTTEEKYRRVARVSALPPEPFIDIVFDGPPSHESGRFVEVEDPNGRSINVGEWLDRGDGFWALRIPVAPDPDPPCLGCAGLLAGIVDRVCADCAKGLGETFASDDVTRERDEARDLVRDLMGSTTAWDDEQGPRPAWLGDVAASLSAARSEIAQRRTREDLLGIDLGPLRDALRRYDESVETLSGLQPVLRAARALVSPAEPATDHPRLRESTITVGVGEQAEGKEQAGDWQRDHRIHESGTVAASVSTRGWVAFDSGGDSLASGPETGDLGRCLADLTLCAHGFLAWERICWGNLKRRGAAISTFDAMRGPAVVTPSTLPAVLAAVRAIEVTP